MPYRIADTCVKCGACYEECKFDAIREEELQYVIDPEKCTDCGACVQVYCPGWAISKIPEPPA